MIYAPVKDGDAEFSINNDPHQHYVNGLVYLEYTYTTSWEEPTPDTDNGPGYPGYYTFDDITITTCDILIWINPVILGSEYDFLLDPAGREPFELDSELAATISIIDLERRPAFRKALTDKVLDYLESQPVSYFD